MRKFTFLFVAFFFTLSTTIAQETVIVFGTAEEVSSCDGKNDQGYYYMWGASDDYSAYDLRKKVEDQLESSYPRADDIETNNNYDWSNYKGDYMVVISTSYTDSDGCRYSMYAAGFGDTRSEALDDAIKFMGTRDWSWSASDEGYNVEETKNYWD